MRLTDQQVAAFHQDGYLVIPGLFSAQETALLRAEVPRIFKLDRPEVPISTSGEVRLAHRLERYSEPFSRLLSHPRMVEPAMQLLAGTVYSHQFKVVTKAPFGSLELAWHQDYGTWHLIDGMPEPRAMNFALFLDEVNEHNGPITLIPRSHRDGMLDAPLSSLEGSSDFAQLTVQTITQLIDENGLFAPKGPPGTGLFFHGCMAHASGVNLTPWPRNIVYSSLNRTDNGITRHGRPEFYANREVKTLVPLPDDCLFRAEP
ncbi:MAG: proline hydroxylase [Chromatiales bacterium]|jgi:ectoine hydroxylase|nr:proline hydroxylase [Chromatiales bacterium]